MMTREKMFSPNIIIIQYIKYQYKCSFFIILSMIYLCFHTSFYLIESVFS